MAAVAPSAVGAKRPRAAAKGAPRKKAKVPGMPPLELVPKDRPFGTWAQDLLRRPGGPLPSGSDEWKAARKNAVTGTMAASILGMSHGGDGVAAVWQRFALPNPPEEHFDDYVLNMFQWGKDHEPIARAVYQARCDYPILPVDVGLLFKPGNPLIAATPDAIHSVPVPAPGERLLPGRPVRKWRMVVEFKCPFRAVFPSERTGAAAELPLVPTKYWVQMQMQMDVTDADGGFLVFYRPDGDVTRGKPDSMEVYYVERDYAFLNKARGVLTAFMRAVKAERARVAQGMPQRPYSHDLCPARGEWKPTEWNRHQAGLHYRRVHLPRSNYSKTDYDREELESRAMLAALAPQPLNAGL